MADSDKNILITPNRGQTAQPSIVFTGQGNDPITLKVLDDTVGAISFEGSAGQLFGITDNLTSGSIFSVNDVSGIPIIDVQADGTLSLGTTGTNIGIGITNPSTKLDVNGNALISGDLTVSGGDISTGAAVASTLFGTNTTGNITLGGALTTGTFTIGATGSTGAVSLFPSTGSQAITLGGATTGTVTIGSALAAAVQLPTGKTKVGQTFLVQGGAVNITLPALAGTLYASGNTDVTLADGGTNASLTAVNGGVVYSTASAMAISAVGSSGQFLRSAGAAAPTWVTLEMTDVPGAAYKKSVKAATTADLGTVTYANGTSGVGATITGPTGASAVVFPAQDGITIALNDRLLVKNQATAAQNGIYTLTTVGVAGTTAWVLTRATDADTNTEIGAAVVAVDQGTANGGELWTTNFRTTDTVGTTAMNWNEVIYNSFSSPTFSSPTLSGTVTTGGTITAGNTAISIYPGNTTTNITIGSGLTTGTFTAGATGSTGAVSLFPATGSQAITLGGATTGTITIGSISANAVQLPTGKTKIGQSFFAQGSAFTYTPSTVTANSTLVASTGAGASGQLLVSKGNAAAAEFESFELSLHAPQASYKSICRVATTTDLGASTFASNVLTGYDDTFTLACTTTAGSATVTVTSAAGTSGIKVGATVSGNANIPAGRTVASIVNATQFTLNSGTSVLAATSITTTFTQTIAALAIDGVTLAVNDRVLVKDQRTLGGLNVLDAAKYNGIYTVTATGSTTVPWTLTRTADADSASDLDGAIVNISVGTANFGKSYKTRFRGTDTLNTTEMYWGRIVDVNSSSYFGVPTNEVGIDISLDAETLTLKTGNVSNLVTGLSIGVKEINSFAASTYSRASSLYIAGAPSQGTNATLTTTEALTVASGASSFNGIVKIETTAGFSVGKNTVTSGYTDLGTNLRLGVHSKTATYSNAAAGTTITVTCANHGLTTGDSVYIDFTAGTAVDGYFSPVTVTSSSIFTVTSVAIAAANTNQACTLYPESQVRFPGVFGDGTNSYDHSIISERLWGAADRSELLIFKGNDGGTTIQDNIRLAASGDIYFHTGAGTVTYPTYIASHGNSINSSTVSILASGNVGIGTSAPVTKLEVFNTATSGHLTLAANDAVGSDQTGIDIDWRVKNQAHVVGRIRSIYETSLTSGSGGLRFYSRKAGVLNNNLSILSDKNVIYRDTFLNPLADFVPDTLITGANSVPLVFKARVYNDQTSSSDDYDWNVYAFGMSYGVGAYYTSLDFVPPNYGSPILSLIETNGSYEILSAGSHRFSGNVLFASQSGSTYTATITSDTLFTTTVNTNSTGVPVAVDSSHNITSTTLNIDSTGIAGTLTADRTKRAMRGLISTTSTLGTATAGQREALTAIEGEVTSTGTAYTIRGVYSNVRQANSTGTTNELTGVRSLVQGDPASGGTVTSVYGGLFEGRHGGAGTVSSLFGAFNYALKETSGTSILPTAIGSRNEVEIDGNRITNAYAAIHVIDIDGGAMDNAYLSYGDYEGTIQSIYSAVASTTVSSGTFTTAATFNITVSQAGVYSATIANGGTGYTGVTPFTVTVPGTSIGGATPANDVTITVTAVTSGVITTITTVAGTGRIWAWGLYYPDNVPSYIGGTIELGNLSDTTLSRSAAGVLAVEGVAVPTISSTNDLTNKTYNGLTVTTGTDTFTLTRGSSTLVRSGAHACTLTTTASTNVTLPTTGTLLATTGSGASLTSLNASQLTSGTVPDARISGAYTGLTALTLSHTANNINATTSTTTGQSTELLLTNASYAGTAVHIKISRAASTAYNFAYLYANVTDGKFAIQGTGTVFSDGAYNATGADYAEYFEWQDGNPDLEDRVGYSVIVENGKIRKAEIGEDPIGVISGTPTVIGDSAWNSWNKKFLTDDFGRRVMEEYRLIAWEETVERYEDGESEPTFEVITHEYQEDRVPSDVIVPESVTFKTHDEYGNVLTREKLNPDYDPTLEYISREHRPEWDTVGLMGKLRLRKGQPVGPRWIKMRDISDVVEEWLVR